MNVVSRSSIMSWVSRSNVLIILGITERVIRPMATLASTNVKRRSQTLITRTPCTQNKDNLVQGEALIKINQLD